MVWGALVAVCSGLVEFWGVSMDRRRKHCVVSWSKALSDFIRSTQETSQYN